MGRKSAAAVLLLRRALRGRAAYSRVCGNSLHVQRPCCVFCGRGSPVRCGGTLVPPRILVRNLNYELPYLTCSRDCRGFLTVVVYLFPWPFPVRKMLLRSFRCFPLPIALVRSKYVRRPVTSAWPGRVSRIYLEAGIARSP